MNRLEQELQRLKIAYEQYFMGIERFEPVEDRRRIKRAIIEAAESPTNNTAMRFRAQTIKSRLSTYENYWNRINKQIEDGTYKRHKFKVKLHEQMAQDRAGRSTAHVDLNADKAGAGHQSVVDQYRSLQQKAGQSPGFSVGQCRGPAA